MRIFNKGLILAAVMCFGCFCGCEDNVAKKNTDESVVDNTVAEEGRLPIVINNETTDIQAVIYNDEVYLPANALFEKLGYTVDVVEERNAIEVSDVYSDSLIPPMAYFSADEMVKFDENHSEKPLDGKVISVGDVLYIPLETPKDAFGIDISYDEQTESVVIKTTVIEKPKTVVSSNNNDFAYELNKLMPDDENYVFSPICLKYALLMAATGSEGDAQSEILTRFGITDIDSFNDNVSAYISKYKEENANGNVVLEPFNAFWLNDSAEPGTIFKDDFKTLAEDSYNSVVDHSDENNIINDINTLCRETTDDDIYNLIGDDDYNYMLNLVNAVSFHGKWETAFNEESTYWESFITRAGNDRNAPLMHTVGNYRYYEDDNIKVVSLPYSGSSVSMYVVLSNDKPFVLEDYIDKMQVQRVDVKIPKFKTDFGRYMKDMLSQVGVKSCFDSQKNLVTGVLENDGQSVNTYIGDMIHRTSFNVDEEGEGAPLPPLELNYKDTAEKDAKQFWTKSPFTYIVRDNSNGEILFMGEYAFVK